MDARVQRRVQRYGWDKAAPYYERFWASQLEPAQRRMLVLAALEPGDRVLDVACGTGLVTLPAGGPVALAYDRFDERTREEAHVEYLASIAPHRRGEAYLVPGEFVVGVAHR